MSRRRKAERDRRTRAEKIRDIIDAVEDAMPDGIGPTERESAQRILARRTRLPQYELGALMPDAVRESASRYPGYRLLINAGRNKQTYKLLKRSRRGDLTMSTARIAKANTAFERAMNELDVALAGSTQRALQVEGSAISALVNGFTTRVREWLVSEEVDALDEVGIWEEASA